MTPKPLPRAIARRIVTLPPHVRALRENLETIGLEDYRVALETRTTSQLNRAVYPVERPFEIIDNFIFELAEEGLAAAGKATGPGPADDLRRLRDLHAISPARCDRLLKIHTVRNAAQHEYADIEAKDVYEAAAALTSEAPGFLQDYLVWLRGFGFEPSA